MLTLSLAATSGQTEKRIDVVSVPLYVSRALYPTAGLYVMFGVLCVLGLRSWSRELRAEAAA